MFALQVFAQRRRLRLQVLFEVVARLQMVLGRAIGFKPRHFSLLENHCFSPLTFLADLRPKLAMLTLHFNHYAGVWVLGAQLAEVLFHGHRRQDKRWLLNGHLGQNSAINLLLRLLILIDLLRWESGRRRNRLSCDVT